MKEITVKAKVENIERVTAFVDAELERFECPMKIQTQIDIAIDECMGNIVHYAYPGTEGDVTVQLEVSNGPFEVVITFLDQGIPYNPLSNEEPDITLGAEERKIGGLGIFMVKKFMDEVDYEYREGQNRLTIRKGELRG